MGRIKSTLIKRTAKGLVEKAPEIFKKDFETNKKVLGRSMPSKRTRNRIAGQITRIKRNTKKIIDEDNGQQDN
jgi:small subunit ribosomal protein S17e